MDRERERERASERQRERERERVRDTLVRVRASFSSPFLEGLAIRLIPSGLSLPLVGREWKNGSNSSYTCSPFLHSLLTKGKFLRHATGDLSPQHHCDTRIFGSVRCHPAL